MKAPVLVNSRCAKKRIPGQIMGDCSFQRAFRHIDRLRIQISNHMYRTAGRYSHLIIGAGKPDVFSGICHKIKPDLKSLYPSFHRQDRDQDAGILCCKMNAPGSILRLIESGDAF